MNTCDDLKKITVSADVRRRMAEEYREFKEWKENHLNNEQTIELFGMKLKIVDSDRSAKDCIECAIAGICLASHRAACETAEHKFTRYFVDIQ